MYRVVIAEDEMLVRLGLKHSINWSDYDMTVIADVANGQEALDLYEKEMPEVLITDIKMPIMDGMELISRVRDINSDAQIIILTCVEDFETVRKALSHNVQDYILKLEMTPEDMGHILARTKEKLDHLHKAEYVKTDVDIEIVKDNLIKEYLHGTRYSEAEFSKKAASLHMRIQPYQVVVTLMEIDRIDHLSKHFKDNKGKLVRISLLKVLSEVLTNYGYGEAFADTDSRYLIIFGFNEHYSEQKMKETIHTIIEHIRHVMNMYFNISISFVINEAKFGFHSMREQYNECVTKLEEKFFLGMGSNTYVGGQNSLRIPESMHNRLLQLVLDWKVNDAAKNAIEKSIISFLDKEINVGATEMKREFKIWLLMAAFSSRLPKADMPQIVSDYSDRITDAQTLEEMLDVFSTYFQTLDDYISNKKSISKEISDVIQYIDENYKRELTLLELAQIVQVSPNYLSSLFKKETGTNFADYLLQYRIDRAKELLLSTFCKTYEVAELTGFSNQSYFSRAFKKLTGIGPKEFRRKWTIHRGLRGETSDDWQ